MLPPGFTVNRLIQGIQANQNKLRCTPGIKTSDACVFFDSFDWRLYHDDKFLQTTDSGGLTLQKLGCSETLYRLQQDKTPVWPADVESDGLREYLASVLEMRALMPMVEVKNQWQYINVVNNDEKTVVRLAIQQSQCFELGTNKIRDLVARIHIFGIKGYDKDRTLIEGLLEEQLELSQVCTCLYLEALTAIGRTPGEYSSKIKVNLQPDETTGYALRTIFLDLLDTLEVNIDGTKADIDSEFLHDLRVATRRTRSALSQVKGVLPEAILDDYKSRFAWVGSVTGPTRDLDVFLLEFDDYRNSLPNDMGDALQPLHEYLEEHQKTEQLALKRKLNSPHFRKLLKEWRSYISADPEPADIAPINAYRPVVVVANERIWKMYKKVLKQGRAIKDDTPAEALHDLRKSCKKLRYLIEFFQTLYPKKAQKVLVKELKVLLENLGNFQDLQVQAEKLHHFAEEMKKECKAPLDTVMAMGALVADLLRLQQQAREEFAGRFAQFDSEGNGQSYRALFAPEKGK